MALSEEQKKRVLAGEVLTDPSTQADYESFVRSQSAGGSGIITGQTLTPPTTDLSSRIQTPTNPVVPDTSKIDTTIQNTATTLSEPEKKVSDLTSRIANLQTALTGKTEYTQQQQTKYGLTELQNAQNDLTAQIKGLQLQQQGLQNQANIIPNVMQFNANPGTTVAGLAPLTAGELRKNSIAQSVVASNALVLQAQLAASQAQIANAQNLIDQAVKTKYGAKEEEIATAKANLEILLKDPAIDLATKNRANAQLEIQKKKEEDLAVEKQKTADILKISTDAAANIDNFTATMQYPTSASALKAISEAKTTQEAQQIQVATGLSKTSTLDTQLKEAQLAKIKADTTAAVAADAAVNPSVLRGMLNVYKATGVLPAFGLSAKSPLRAQFYAALGADGGIVTEATTNKSIRAGLNTAYSTQQNQLSANETAINTLEQQLTLAKQYSDKVARSNSPLVAHYVIGLRTGLFGDPDAAALNNIVKTASYEFAKILSGSAASISGATVNSQADAETLLNSAMSKGQFNTVIGLMEKEANFRLNSQRDTLKRLENDLGNIGSLSNTLKNNKTKSGKTFDYEGAKKAGHSDKEIQDYLDSH